MKTPNTGFTLVELLVALFIFSMVSLLLMQALHQVMAADERTASTAQRLHDVQMAFTVLSRDLSQAGNRAIINEHKATEAPFKGDVTTLTFTHASGALWKRTQYQLADASLQRLRWTVLDRMDALPPRQKTWLRGVKALHFSYLDQDKHFHDQWPANGAEQALPRAVKVIILFDDGIEMSQHYAIPAQSKI